MNKEKGASTPLNKLSCTTSTPPKPESARPLASRTDNESSFLLNNSHTLQDDIVAVDTSDLVDQDTDYGCKVAFRETLEHKTDTFSFQAETQVRLTIQSSIHACLAASNEPESTSSPDEEQATMVRSNSSSLGRQSPVRRTPKPMKTLGGFHIPTPGHQSLFHPFLQLSLLSKPNRDPILGVRWNVVSKKPLKLLKLYHHSVSHEQFVAIVVAIRLRDYLSPGV